MIHIYIYVYLYDVYLYILCNSLDMCNCIYTIIYVIINMCTNNYTIHLCKYFLNEHLYMIYFVIIEICEIHTYIHTYICMCTAKCL